MSESVQAGNLLIALSVGGLLGIVGQAVRAVAGLKKMADYAASKSVSAHSMFSASWFFVSMTIGFVAGVIATLTLGVGKLLSFDPDNTQLLVGIAAAGYAGTDFVEAFASRLSGGLLPKSLPATSAESPKTSFPA